MFLIILKNGLNKYNQLLWILFCVLVVIIMSSYIANNEKKFNKVVNSVTFHVKNKEKQPIKDFEIYTYEIKNYYQS